MTPLGRIGQSSDIASVVTFLASEDASDAHQPLDSLAVSI
jgi:hypothetical protein